MTQYVINIGAIPNDGTGDPLRTAFNEVNLNFDQVFAAGPVGSNIQIANNTILTTNTNGNLVLAPNGIGIVQSNVSIVPNTSNIRNLGSSTQRWSSLYVQYASISGNLDLAGTFSVGDLNVTGNLTVTGNTIQIGNIVTETLTIQLGNSAATANAANGAGITVGASDNIATLLYSNTANSWTTNIGISSVGNITAPYFIGDGSELTGISSTGNLDIVGTDISIASGAPETLINISPNGEGWAFLQLPNDATANSANTRLWNGAGNVEIGSGDFSNAGPSYTWLFGKDGTTIFPTLTVTRGDRSGTLTGQALLFGDSTQEAIISTPNGTNTIASSQRFVINPGAGADGTNGEGGDIYLYAGRGGDAGGSGGDIKIRGGLGPVDGAGGYLDIQGGDAQGNGVGGDITINGGQSANNNGGQVSMAGGQGQVNGGPASISGGYGATGQGGQVNITGGSSSAGLSEYGNVEIGSGIYGWSFNNTGNLVLPQGGVVYETSIPGGVLAGNTIALKPAGGIDADQQLLIYPTVIPGTDDNHLHLTTGNLYNTELYLGSDNLYVKLANTGNIVLNANDSAGNTTMWTFGIDSVLSTPVSVDIFAGTSLPGLETNYTDSVAVLSDAFTQNSGEAGYPWGITLPVSYLTYDELILLAPGTFPNQIACTTQANNTKNTYQVWQDAIALTNVTLTANELNWTFDSTGNLTLPSGGNLIVSGSIVGSGASPAPSLNGFSSVSAITLSATGNITGGNILTGAKVIANGVIETGTGFSTGGYLSVDGTADLHNTTVTGNISATGNVTGAYILGNGASMTGVATKTTGSWTLVAGTNTANITVPLNATYSMWVRGNIPNGIVVWNATVTVTNNNVPAIGQQFAWYYPAPGNALVLTSIPAQIIGTANTISNATPAVGTTSNVFEFTIDNNSGNSAVVDYGYTKIS